jgi:hypothetical protein
MTQERTMSAHPVNLFPHSFDKVWRAGIGCGLLALAAGCGGGGGGGGEPTLPTLGPLGVALAATTAGSGTLTVRLTLPANAAGRSLTVPWRTADLGSSTGFARGGAACGGDVDYVAVAAGSLQPAALDVTVAVTLCPNTTLEPDERFEVQFDWNGATQRVEALIVNDAAGGLNDTGVAICLDETGAVVSCGATRLAGQDALLGRDARALTSGGSDGRLGFAFEAAGSCTRDRVTGLVWDAASSAATAATAEAAVAAANAAARCGATDWRLPTVAELASLVDSGAAAAPFIDPALGTTPSAAHWSAESYALDGRARWVVDFASGAVAFETAVNPLAKPAAVRAVRGGPAATVPGCTDSNPARYVDHANGTVTDNSTGLMWMQCTEGLSGAACATGTATVYRSFGDALARAQTVNSDRTGAGRGFADWRVPNRNELASLVLRSCPTATSPGAAIQRTRFPGTPALSAWSSTPARAGFAWYVDFSDGTVAPGGVSGDRVLRLVRAGQ